MNHARLIFSNPQYPASFRWLEGVKGWIDSQVLWVLLAAGVVAVIVAVAKKDDDDGLIEGFHVLHVWHTAVMVVLGGMAVLAVFYFVAAIVGAVL